MKPDNVKYEALKEKSMAQISQIRDLAYPISRDLKLRYESYDWVTPQQKKYEASRMIAVPVHVIEAVQEYVRHFRAATDPRALFCGPKGAMSRDRLRMVIREIGKKAGVPLLHSHAFRHRVATSLFNAGADLRSVQQHLGHVSPLSTRVYDHGDRQLASRNNADLLNAYYKGVRKGAKYECLAGRDITTRGEGFARILRIPVVLVSPFRHPLAGEASC